MDEIVRLHDEHKHLYSGHEIGTAEPVALALFNKGVRLGALDRSAEELAVYDDVVFRYGGRQEPALAEKVAKALFNKGVRLGALDRSAEELAVYDDLVSRYGDCQEPALAEQVANALVNKGVRLGALDRSAEELAVYDDVVSRYGDRQEPALAEKVTRALGSKGWSDYDLGRYADSVVSSRAALDREPKAMWVLCNLALALLHLGEIEAAKDAYAEAARGLGTVEELDRLALTDLDAAIVRWPDLAGAKEIRALLVERREALAREDPEA